MRPRPGSGITPLWCLAVILGLAVCGCGGGAKRSASSATSATTSSTAALPPTCAPGARAVIERAFAGPVRARVGESGQATPECVFRVGRARVTVLMDSFAQPYQRLERVQIEDAQQFGTQRIEAIPQPISGLGIDAYWFPTERKVMTTEGRRLITVFVARRGLPARRQRRLAEAIAQQYLGPNDPRAADPNGS